MRATVLGAGSWGTALAILLARNDHEVTLYGRDPVEMEAMAHHRENFHYLPGFALPANVRPTAESALEESDLWVVAAPSQGVRGVLGYLKGERPLVVMASKGMEAGTSLFLHQVAAEAAPQAIVGAISGPNLAVEIVRGIPTAAVCAFEELAIADQVRMAFMSRAFRVYTSDDIVGIEVGGALKNVLALGAGMSDGLGYGDNTKGALLSRGLHEMAKIGLAMGARLDTFLGIAGVGDLFATATSQLSRNYRVGRLVGEGKTLSEALAEVGQVAEGVSTSESVLVVARRLGLQAPTFEAIETVLRGRVSPSTAVGMLMERLPKSEGVLLGSDCVPPT